MDQTVRLWNVKSGEVVHVWREHEHVVECVAFSTPLADQFINAMRIEEAKTNGAPIPQINGAVTPVAASSSSAAASASSASAAASSSSAKAAAAAGTTPAGGLYLASASRDRSIRIWEVSTGTCIKVLTSHDNWVNEVVWHPSGRFLLSCSDDKSVRVFDITKGFRHTRKMAVAHNNFVSALAWNSSPPLLATAGVDATVKVWECR
jgi:platelet-activating factor acetylhydrolase IB subunit alpha